MKPLTHEEHQRLLQLLDELCDAGLSSEEQRELETVLTENQAAQQVYVRYMDLQAGIRGFALATDGQQEGLLESSDASEDSDVPPGEHQIAQRNQSKVSGRRIRSAIFAAMASVAAVIAVAVWGGAHSWWPPSDSSGGTFASSGEAQTLNPLIEAKLYGAVGARWGGSSPVIIENSYFLRGTQLELQEGLAEIMFACGARIVVQGPAAIGIVDGQTVSLSQGRLAAYVPNDYGPFFVDTKQAKLTASSGEFGADIDADGSVEMRVYYGDVSIKAPGEFGRQNQLRLTGSEGARFDAKNSQLFSMLRPNHLHFVRYLSQAETTVNLADLVGGIPMPNEVVHSGISLHDGSRVQTYVDTVEGSKGFTATPTIRGVDGVFIPDGTNGGTQVDSIGRSFAHFPPTTGKTWSGAIMARRPSLEQGLSPMRLEFQDGIYGYINWLHVATKPEELCPENRGLIGIHANGGITFDLHAIRRQYPNHEMLCFRALVGNLEAKPERFEAEAWVLVDGEQRYHRSGFSREDGPDVIEIPLHSKDRFLVLAATDSDGDTAFDWVTFGDAVVEMQLDDRQQMF
ncbi:NPCBM/NEW2 domain-containing protein [Aeoliella mucimassa]|uniref:FecR protein n=1 Tax=Aeoliella mucimassa TaxID=2527972 RepID=A0A518AQP9_9BACT|nr:NPCBM/NEW2 domain-containing protein [Aeoliella mucimassa]QDU57033.1 FecR protein [Aeoliella mucimassa]